MSSKLFKTAIGLDINGVKLFYGIGTPQSQTQIPLLEGAFYFDGQAGVTYVVESGTWNIRGGGEAQYIVFDNTTAQLPGNPQTVQDVLDQLDSIIESLGQSASTISFDNTVAQIPGSPEPSTVQEALEAILAMHLALQQEVFDHLSDTVDAHDATAISYDGSSSGIASSDVQGAIDDLDSRLDYLETIPPGAASASTTSFDNSVTQLPGSPDIVTVQDAIEALDSRIDTIETNPVVNSASDVTFDNTVAQIPGSPAVANVQDAIDYLVQNQGQGGMSVTWQVVSDDFNIVSGGHYIVDTTQKQTCSTVTTGNPEYALYDINDTNQSPLPYPSDLASTTPTWVPFVSGTSPNNGQEFIFTLNGGDTSASALSSYAIGTDWQTPTRIMVDTTSGDIIAFQMKVDYPTIDRAAGGAVVVSLDILDTQTLAISCRALLYIYDIPTNNISATVMAYTAGSPAPVGFGNFNSLAQSPDPLSRTVGIYINRANLQVGLVVDGIDYGYQQTFGAEQLFATEGNFTLGISIGENTAGLLQGGGQNVVITVQTDPADYVGYPVGTVVNVLANTLQDVTTCVPTPVTASLPETLDNTFYAHIKDANGNFVNNPLIIQANDQTSPYVYTIAGAQAVEVDIANADITLGYDGINNNVVI